MKTPIGLCFLALCLSLIFGVVCFPGCANIVPPSGGPKDTIPPRLVSALPVDSVKHFAEKKIILNFDEYIDGKDLRAELVVNPVPKVDPIVDAKLKVITIRIKDTLQPNTTYSFHFGKGIKDVNEDNVLKNFIYVFSTGDVIDKGDFTGNIFVANTGKADSTLVAMLHVTDSDSAVIKDRPRYIAKTDSTGRFHFQFVKPGKYWLYGLKDEGASHKYLSKAQLFAFADSPVVIGASTPPVTIYAYAETAGETKPSSGSSTPAKKSSKKQDTRLQVTTNATGGAFDVLDTFKLTFSSGLKVFDSTQLRFTDENYKDLPLTQYRYIRDTTNRVFTLLYTWPTDTKFLLVLPRTFGQDSLGRKLIKDDTISFKTKKDIEYGEVQIRVMNLDLSRHPVLLFVQSDKIKYSIPFTSRRSVRKILFPPGEYELRILYDANRNGVWDPGKFFGKGRKQPEKVITIRKKMNVKANWDNDWDTNL
ncbi:MAG TPA: Ig-like domain-containing domain [Puia sp.]|nr:Ig-like domain-containing domain [Puia sp.]